MATIDYEIVKDSVGELYKAGKEFPQKEMFFAVPQNSRAAKAAEIMQDTINAIANHFVPQKISVGLWKKAVDIAKVSADKAITPKLLHDALQEAQKQYAADTVAKAEQEKQAEQNVFRDCSNDEKLNITAMLLRWTYAQMGRRREICPYLPSEEQISNFVLNNNIAREVAQKYRTVIRAYLNDYNYQVATGERMSCKLFNRGDRLELRLI